MQSLNGAESAEEMKARHGREVKELQGRINNKKKNATKKTRKGVNAECEELERLLREKQAVEMGIKSLEENNDDDDDDDDENKKAQLKNTSKEESTNKADEETKIIITNPNSSMTIIPPKKRNRQRQRLARRAAERTAEAQGAIDEAATMTDHRALESKEMKKAMEEYDLFEYEIAPDGHCLFSAVADQLEQCGIPLGGGESSSSSSSSSEPVHRLLRRVAVAYMVENADEFSPFLSEHLDVYVARMRDTAEWGGQLELTALARRYGAEIRVLEHGRVQAIGEEEGKATGKTLWLAYYRHGYGLGEHYNSLRKRKT